jgi:segregation and condensation protein B
VPGKPLQYGTTQHFLERFGLRSLKDLPSIQEFRALG